MRLAVLVLVAGLSCLAAAGSCNGGKPAPSPTTIPSVIVIGPVHQEAGTECGSACERRRSEGCPSGNAPKSIDHCVAICTAGRMQLEDPTADCLALISTCNERCSR